MKFYRTWIGDIVNMERVVKFEIKNSETKKEWYIVNAYFSKKNMVEFCEIFEGYFWDDEEPEKHINWNNDYVDMYLQLLISYILTVKDEVVTYDEIHGDVWDLFIRKVNMTKKSEKN